MPASFMETEVKRGTMCITTTNLNRAVSTLAFKQTCRDAQDMHECICVSSQFEKS